MLFKLIGFYNRSSNRIFVKFIHQPQDSIITLVSFKQADTNSNATKPNSNDHFMNMENIFCPCFQNIYNTYSVYKDD
ncbi:unnamed protein product [Rhizophagus irregularis]|nr:unnamed protein product [Rhizophagus irregularis]